MAGKRKRENRRKRRREKGRNGAGGGSPTRRVGEGVEEAQSSVEIGSSLAASTAVPTIPTLPPAGTGTGGSSPWQSLRDLASWLVKWALSPLRAVFVQDIEEEETEAEQEAEADSEYLEVLDALNDLYDQLASETDEVKRAELEKQIGELQQRRVKLQEARSSKTT